MAFDATQLGGRTFTLEAVKKTECKNRYLVTNYIQGGDADVSCTVWLRTTLLGVVIHMCRRHAAPTQAQVRLHRTI